MAKQLTGVGATPRSGVGTVIWYERESTVSADTAQEPSDDPAVEFERFETARNTAIEEVETERDRTRERVGDEEANVFEAHKQFLKDPQIESAVKTAVESGVVAENAVREAFAGPIKQFSAMDGMMAERADDLRDVRDRLIRILSGAERTDLSALPDGSVVFADLLTPSDTAQLSPESIAGVATVKGGRTSHAAIIARSLGIPAVVGVGDDLRTVTEGETVVVDGNGGTIIVGPDRETIKQYEAETTAAVTNSSVTTANSVPIEVAGNLGTPAEAPPAVKAGADGVGLFRTEFLFLDRDAPPTEDEQFEAYYEVCSQFADRCANNDGHVIIRTADIGGDKPIPYLSLDPEENGFLGARGIRLSLEEHTDLFETQLRALLRVAATDVGDSIAVMFPLVSTVEELAAAIDRVERVQTALDAEGVTARVPELGVMIETPGSVFLANAFAKRVDFLSIGTNDLVQYVLAAQRDLDRMDSYQDPLAPAVLRAIDHTTTAAENNDAWVGMCGEMAGDPTLTELLIGLGLSELSMSAVTIPEVKQAVKDTDTAAARELAETVLACETHTEVRAALEMEK